VEIEARKGLGFAGFPVDGRAWKRLEQSWLALLGRTGVLRPGHSRSQASGILPAGLQGVREAHTDDPRRIAGREETTVLLVPVSTVRDAAPRAQCLAQRGRERFRCRRCQGLRYYSERESRPERLLTVSARGAPPRMRQTGSCSASSGSPWRQFKWADGNVQR